MAAPMDTVDVDQRLSMSLDDLIKSKSKQNKQAPARSGTAPAKTTGRRRRSGAGKPPADLPAKPSETANKRAARRGGKKVLGVQVKSLKNAPKKLVQTAAKLATNVKAKARVGRAGKNATGSKFPPQNARRNGKVATTAAPTAIASGGGSRRKSRERSKSVNADAPVLANLKISFWNTKAGGKNAGGSSSGRGSAVRVNSNGLKVPTGW